MKKLIIEVGSTVTKVDLYNGETFSILYKFARVIKIFIGEK